MVIRDPTGAAFTIQENVVTVKPDEVIALTFSWSPWKAGTWEIEVMALDYETRAPLAPSAFAYVHAYTV